MRWTYGMVVLGCLGPAIAHADATHVNLEAALEHDSNIGRSEYRHDIQEDTALLVGANASHSIRLTDNSGVVARAGIQLKEQAHYNDLSELSVNAGARYRIQPVPGFTMPWIDLSLGAERLEYRDSDIRDSWITNAGIAVGKYFTDRLRASFGWTVERRNAQDSSVFDLHNRRWQLDVDFRVTPQGTLYVKGARVFGDQVSSAPQSSLSPQPLQYAVQTADPALSEHGEARNAYRFDAVVDTMEIGYNHALRGNLALDISARYFEGDADGGHVYRGYSARAGLLYQF